MTLLLALSLLVGIDHKPFRSDDEVKIWSHRRALLASRNSSGTFSLYTPGNPVVTNTTISSSWANNTLSDMGTELTNSLDRLGRGAMLAPLQLANGSVSSPSLTWASDSGSGLYRIGAHDLGFSVNGALALEFSTVVSAPIDFIADSSGLNAGAAPCLRFGSATSGEGICSKRTATGNQFGLDFYTGGVVNLKITNLGLFEPTGPMLAPPGSVSAPSYSWANSNDQNTGFYQIGSHDIGFAVNGVKTHEWTASGEVVTGTLTISGGIAQISSSNAGSCSITCGSGACTSSVTTGCKPVCSSTTIPAGGQVVSCAVSGTTLTATEYNGTCVSMNVNYICFY